MWFKCVCGESHYGPQVYVDGVMVCPHCKSPDLTQITQEEAMRNKLPCGLTIRRNSMRGEKSGRDDLNEPTKADLIDRIGIREFRRESSLTSLDPKVLKPLTESSNDSSRE